MKRVLLGICLSLAAHASIDHALIDGERAQRLYDALVEVPDVSGKRAEVDCRQSHIGFARYCWQLRCRVSAGGETREYYSEDNVCIGGPYDPRADILYFEIPLAPTLPRERLRVKHASIDCRRSGSEYRCEVVRLAD